MASYQDPILSIGGVNLPEQAFRWVLQAGVIPYQTNLRAHNANASAIAQLANPTFIEVTAYGGINARSEPLIFRISNVWIVEPRPIDDFYFSFTVADSRFSWRGKKLYFSYNRTRVANVRQIAVSASETNPAILRQPFDTFRAGRYLSWSVKVDGRPFNSIEIIQEELARVGIEYIPQENFDGAYIIENLEVEGEDIYRAISDLLRRGRLQLGINLSGQVYVYSIDFFNNDAAQHIISKQGGTKVGAGKIYTQEKSRIRPARVRVFFEKMEEVRVVADPIDRTVAAGGPTVPVEEHEPVWGRNEIIKWKVIGCKNVMPVPYPITLGGRTFQIGEFIPVRDFMRGISPPIDEARFRELFFASTFEAEWAGDLADQTGAVFSQVDTTFVQHISSALRNHYRQTYQIDPYYMDRIERWFAKRSGVIDTYSRFSPPSPLFSDYCVIPNARVPALALRQGVWDTAAYNWIVNERDFFRENATAGVISIVNHDLGIFRINYPYLVDMTLRRIIPSGVDPLPNRSLSSTHSLLANSHLLEEYTMETIISVIWATDRNDNFGDESKYWIVDLDYSDQGGTGPQIDYLSRLEHARLPIKEVNSDGVVLNNQNVPLNLGLLQALAGVEGAKLINQYRDRFSGMVKLAGFVQAALFANMKSISYNLSSSRGVYTEIDWRDIPPAPRLEHLLPQKAIDYIYRHVSRGDTRNEVG